MKKPLKIAVIGANGRMGQEIQKLLAEDPGASAEVGVVLEGKAQGFKLSAKGVADKSLRTADVWIDFSSAEGFSETIRAAVLAEKPLVSGITGLSMDQKKELARAGKKIPLLWSANMSVGIAALKKAIRVAAELEGFDFQIEETHHRHKKDKPSGTALVLQDTLSDAIGKAPPSPLAIRGGGVFGVHKVWMMADDEVLCFEHQALNRTVFARGALRAAKWLVAQKAGLYSMDQMLGGSR